MTRLPDIERYVERNFAASDRAAVMDLIGNAEGAWYAFANLNEPISDDA